MIEAFRYYCDKCADSGKFNRLEDCAFCKEGRYCVEHGCAHCNQPVKDKDHAKTEELGRA